MRSFLERAGLAVLISVSAGCGGDAGPRVGASATGDTRASSDATVTASAPHVQPQGYEEFPEPMRNAVGVTRIARNPAPEFGGDIGVVWFVPPEGRDARGHVDAVLEHLKPTLAQSNIKVLVLQTDNRGSSERFMFWYFLHRGERGWQQDATAEESRKIMILMGYIPIGGAPTNDP